jgi:hypothetical protein
LLKPGAAIRTPLITDESVTRAGGHAGGTEDALHWP